MVAEAEGKTQVNQSVSVGALNVAAPTATITGNSTDGYPVTGTAPANAAIEILNDDNEVVGSGLPMETVSYDHLDRRCSSRKLASGSSGNCWRQEYRSPATTIVVPEDNAEDQTGSTDCRTCGCWATNQS